MMTKARAALTEVGAADEPGKAEIARKAILEGKLASILEFRRRMTDSMSLLGVPVFHVTDLIGAAEPAVARVDPMGATVMRSAAAAVPSIP